MAKKRRKGRHYRNQVSEPQPVQSSSGHSDAQKKMKDLLSYAKASVDISGALSRDSASSRISTTTRTMIDNYFSNIESNATNIAGIMKTLYESDGSVRKIIDYYTTIIPYNYNIYPELNEKDGIDVNSIQLDEYISIAQQIEKYQINLYAPTFVRSALINGVGFFYEVSSSSGVVYLEFPMSLCKVVMIEDGVYRWGIDVTKISEDIEGIEGFPNEIKNAIASGPDENSNKWSGNYYLVGNKGFAVTFDMDIMTKGGLTISPLASLIYDYLNIDTAKQNVDVKDDIDALRIVHGKIETDDQGTPLIPPKEAEEWMRVLRWSLPSGVATAVTPFNLDNISLVGAGNQGAYSTVKDAQKQMYRSAGVASSIFGDESTSSNIVKLSIQKDINWVYEYVIPTLNAYYSYTSKRFKTNSGISWKTKLIKQSHFTKNDDLKFFKDAISFGGSRTDYMVAMGMTPLEVYSKLAVEQRVLDIDSIMVPKPTSHTLSGGATSNESGRPVTDNPTDDTDRINDAN